MTREQAFRRLSELLAAARSVHPQPPAVIAGMIRELSVREGVHEEYMLRKAWIESRYNPLAVNPSTRAAGLYQIMWFNCVAEWRTNTDFNPFDAEDNILWTCNFTRVNTRLLRQNGHNITLGTLYLAHQQGAQGANTILRGAARGMDIEALPDQIQRNVEANIPTSQRGRVQTCGDFVELWERLMQRAHVPSNLIAYSDDNDDEGNNTDDSQHDDGVT